MTRKTKKTARRYPKVAREIIALGNDLDRISRRLHALAESVAIAEGASEALDRYYAHVGEAKS